MGAAAREAPGDEGKPSGFSLIRSAKPTYTIPNSQRASSDMRSGDHTGS